MSNLKKSVGREVWAMLLDDSSVVSTGTLVANHLYAIKTRAASDSGLPAGLEVGDAFFGQNGVTITLATGDSVIDLGSPFDTEKLIGFARAKDISRTKSTVDMSVDGDLSDTGDVRVDPIVAVSGNINGLKVNGLAPTTASRKIDSMFVKQIVQAADGTVTTIKKTDTPVLIAFVYIKTLRADNSVDVDLVPCVFTTNGDSTDYGSATAKTTAFTGCAASPNGVLPQSITAVLPPASV